MARILVVDDDDLLREFLTVRLAVSGHSVAEAGDGLTALDCIVAGNFELILLDDMMPGLSGWEVVETNHVLNRTLVRINRVTQKRRIAAIRNLAAFGNRSVQGTLERLMLDDPSTEVRLEAAIAITVAGNLPAPWSVIRAVCEGIKIPSPNHYRLFEHMMPETCDAMLAIVTMHDDRVIRLLAIHALGFADPEKAIPTLRSLIQDTDGEVAAKAAASLERLSLASPRYKPVRKAAVMYLVDKQAA